ncbi:MAG: gliding motility-associated protein GldE [Taibaiella sp.]|nr:gliding motility-associated protein GldE [Taibaiella sp.]
MTAVIAGAETAFFSLSAKDIFFLKTKEKGSARQATQLLEQPKLLLATLLVSNNFINIAIVITTNMLIKSMIPPTVGVVMAFIIQVVGVTFLLVLFGEVLPKVYATQNNLRMALFSSPYIRVLTEVFRPVSSILVHSTKFIESKISSKSANNISNEDFEHAIELTVGHSATKEEVNIFKGILKFGNITATQIMRTRLDVTAIDCEMTFAEVQAHCLEAGYSRLPVYKETLDKVVGIIHTKDFLPHLDDVNFDWHPLVRPAYYVHEGKLIEDLLKEFQLKRIHFAMVVDEFGGTSGIITLEDIMEEIIGDIKDEFDEDDLNYKKIDNNTYTFEGKTLLNDMCRVIGLPSDTFDGVRGESDSLAGLILEILGKFAIVNDTVKYLNFEFTVLALDKMRIQKVKLTIHQPPEKDQK